MSKVPATSYRNQAAAASQANHGRGRAGRATAREEGTATEDNAWSRTGPNGESSLSAATVQDLSRARDAKTSHYLEI